MWHLLTYIIVLHAQDVETVVVDISGAIQQHKNLSDVKLEYCCDELTRGVVGGIVVSQCIQKFSFGPHYFSKSTVLANILYTYCVCSVATACLCYDLYTTSGKYSKEVLKSLEHIKNSPSLRDFTLDLFSRQLPSHYMASIVCGCFQSRTLEKLEIDVEEVRAYYKLCPIL